MLKLYSRLYLAKTTDELANLATDIGEYYKQKTRKNRGKIIELDQLSFLSILDLQSIVSNTYGYRHVTDTIDLIFFPIIPTFATNDGSHLTKVRTITSLFLNTFSITSSVESVLLQLGVPNRYLHHSVNLLYSLAHVVGTQLSMKSDVQFYNSRQRTPNGENNQNNQFKLNLFTILSNTMLVAGTAYSINMIVKFINKYVPRVPSEIIGNIIAYPFAIFLHHVESLGFSETIETFFESAVQFVTSKCHKKLPPLPLDFNVPKPLECPICQDLLQDTKESLGFFFCSKCIKRWIKASNSPVHPMTGEKLSMEMMQSSVIMNEVAYKYHKLVINDLHAKGIFPENEPEIPTQDPNDDSDNDE
ncbi:hypothetical protein M9Y10_008150 [Tritrichomonas musculus]|uniref:Peroxin-12 n=1 Tax=Tritrichomonas musculus TaxID=1915356 RepID=A0ABR2IY51_9EUKA